MERITNVDGIEDGEYIATWGGIVLTICGKSFTTEDSMGVPSMEVKCKVINNVAYAIGFL